jgi:type II secretory pathway predicted ATPase ExeA
MDASYFGLKQRPFRATPDSACYYPATEHEAALTRIIEAIQGDEGLILLTGEPGTGKTLLAHRLIERLGCEVTTALLTNSHLPDRTSLLQAISFDLNLAYENKSEQELRLGLTQFLITQCGNRQRTVVLLDEAQHLQPDVLEELRLLGNLEAGAGKAFQAVLIGQSGILETVRRPELAAFSQRLTVRIHLSRLGIHEAADYLVHLVRMAGGRGDDLFTDEALETLARGTGGVPRLLNQAAHRALTLCFGSGVKTVDVEAALEALAQMGLEACEEESQEECSATSKEPEESDEELPEVPMGLRKDGPALAATMDSDPPPNDRRPGRLFAGPRRPA